MSSSDSSSSDSASSSSSSSFSPHSTSSDIELRRSKRIRSQPLQYAYEQEDSLVYRNLRREREEAPQEPDEYEVDSDTEEEEGPISPPIDEEEMEESSPPNENGWNTNARYHHRDEFPLSSDLTSSSRECSSPLSFFQLFIPDSMIDSIVEATNQYGKNKFKEAWVDTDRNEIKKILAVIIYMGINKSPTLQSYWSEDVRSPFVTKLFPSRDRFLRLYRCLYIATGQRNMDDPIWHVRSLISQLTQSFPQQIQPGRVLVVDEALVHCKARSKLKQYIKKKPYKWGYKIWCLASEGYLIQFIIYQGKRSSEDNEKPEEVVLRLIQPYYGVHHIVVMDNLFSSPNLYTTLLQHGTYALGTVRPNRTDFPKNLTKEVKSLDRGDWCFRQKGNLVAYLFMDRAPVYFLSTFYYPTQTAVIDRRHKNGELVSYKVPAVVKAYNEARSAVDTVDQLESYYAMGRKNRRWWPRLLWWLLDMCIINSYKLYNMKHSSNISLQEFREKLMHELAGDTDSHGEEISLKKHKTTSDNQNQHWPIHVEDRGRCWYCYHKKSIEKKTFNKCKSCDMYLCVYSCFEDYHTTSIDV